MYIAVAFWRKRRFVLGENMNTTNLTLIALLFLLLNYGTLSATQVLLLLALLSTANCVCNSLCGNATDATASTT